MSGRALRVRAEVNIHAATCPGVWLPRRDDVYLSVCMFGQVRRTLLTSPVFPLLFHQKFVFDKVFYTLYDASQVANSLDNQWVTVEVIQMSDIYDGGRLLASYESTVRDFLYPYPSYSPTYGTTDREILLDRSLDFPGISPKLEFSSRAVIEEVTAFSDAPTRKSRGRPRSRSRSRSRGRSMSRGRARSMSPAIRRRLTELSLDDYEDSGSNDLKPPFVVRKTNDKLIGRVPGSGNPAPLHGFNRQRRKSLPSSDLWGEDYCSYLRPRTTLTNECECLDDEVARLTISRPLSSRISRPLSASYSSYSRPLSPYRSPSPYRYSHYRPLSPSRADVISARVDRALDRQHSLERLDQLDRLDRAERLEHVERHQLADRRYYGTMTDLELDLALSRARARRSLVL